MFELCRTPFLEHSFQSGDHVECTIERNVIHFSIMATDTSALEVINVKDGEEERLPKEVRLENGNKVLIHDESAYENYFKDGASFETFTGNSDPKLLRFQFDFKLHRDGLKEMKTLGNTLRSNPMAVYHNYMMWTYAYSIAIVHEAEDPLCVFEMISVGPNFAQKPNKIPGAYGNNCPPNQSAPMIKHSSLVLVGENKEQTVRLKQNGDGFLSNDMIPMSLLKSLMGETTVVNLRVSLDIEMTYFDIQKNLSRDMPEVKMPPAAAQLLSTILKGQKPNGYDWVITVSDGSPREFYVHGRVLADASPLIEAAIRTHRSSSQENLLMVSHENRFILPKVHAQDMKVLLTYFYTRRVLLPSWETISRVGRSLCALLPPPTVSLFFAYWQNIITDQVITMKHDDEETIGRCTRFLIAIFSAPYGALPIAKRATVAKLADAWNYRLSQDPELEEGKGKEFMENELPDCSMVQNVLYSAEKFRTVIGSVQKIGI